MFNVREREVHNRWILILRVGIFLGFILTLLASLFTGFIVIHPIVIVLNVIPSMILMLVMDNFEPKLPMFILLSMIHNYRDSIYKFQTPGVVHKLEKSFENPLLANDML